MVKKIVLGIVVAVLVIAGVGIQQASARQLPEGSLMRPIDVRNCAERVPDAGLAKGARGHCVWILQVALDREGYEVSTDGQFGPKTADMVSGFNHAYGLNRNSNGEPQATATCETFMKLAAKLTPWEPYQHDDAVFNATDL